MAQLLSNNISGVLATTLSSGATSMTLVDGSTFPAPSGGDYFLATLIGLNSNGQENAWEIVQVTARASNTMTIVRAQEGTSAATWAAATTVQMRLTAGSVATQEELDTGLATKEPTITAGTTAQYWRGDKSWRDFFTDVRASTLTGLSTATNAVITAADTVLSALGKLQKQTTDLTTTVAGKIDSSYLDTDVTLAANSDTKIATQKAVKAYADGLIAANDAMVFKGVIDCSANPNYPAADRGWTYRVSVAGKIGGASGPNVEAGDILLCLTDSTASGDHATVGANWSIIQVNIDGAVTLTGTQTLTNKTLTSPAIATPTITGLKETKVAMGANDIDLSLGNVFTKTISGTTTLTVSNVPATGTAISFVLALTNGGSATVTWFSGVKWKNGSPPSLTVSGRDVLVFITHDGGTTWDGFLPGPAMA